MKLHLGGTRRKFREDLKLTEQKSHSISLKGRKKDTSNPDRISAADYIPVFVPGKTKNSFYEPPEELSQWKIQ